MNKLQLENYIPINIDLIKKAEKEFEIQKKHFYNLIDSINKEYIEAGLGHIIHLRDDDTINWDGCCRSCCWHP